MDFTYTIHIHNWCCFSFGSVSSFFLELFLHWSQVAYWAPTDLGSSSFSVLSFCLFMLFMGFTRQEYWSGLLFRSSVDHILSELSTMTRPSWLALHSMAHSFIELDKAMVHVIRLVSFLWLWLSVCPLMEKNKRLMEAFWWERLTEGETGSCSDGWGHVQQMCNPIFCWWAVFLPCCFDLRPKYGRGNTDSGTSFKRSKAWREHNPTFQQKNGLKIYWAWPGPSEQDPDSPSGSLSHQEASISLLSIRGQTEWNPQSQKTNQTDHMDHSLV